MTTTNKTWLILDSRAWSDPDDAICYEAFDSEDDTLESVKAARKERWPDGVIFEYDQEEREDGKTYLVNQTLIG